MRFWLHPTSLQRKLPNGWRVLNQTCFNSPSDLTQSRKSMDSLCQSGPIRANKCQSSISGTIEFDANPELDGQFNPDMLYSHHRFNKNFGSIIILVGLTMPHYRCSMPPASPDMNLRQCCRVITPTATNSGTACFPHRRVQAS